ncbi:hypothetical protein C1H46_003405 [Malus baccata]|uniref:Rx N-terminal domain-containing protein n=1 Tax=Malus baccata TaxID=106549 RepID=A0A540NKG3_MALBA|nr:hypothetical protein C1H46_003405 [Malus baccata]
MAEGVLFNVAARIIGRLGSLAFQEIRLIWGVQDELHKLQEIVAGFQGVLLDAEQKQTNNEVKLWLQSVEDAVYEADDLLDEFNTEAQQRQMMCGNTKMSKKVRLFLSSSNQLAFGLKMSHKIKDINKRLREVASRRAFPLEVNCEDTRFIIRERITHSFVPKENIIGRDEDKKSIIQLLLDPISTENVSTISIVGFGGLGKTALAQLILNDEIDMDELQNDLRRKVDGKKYLIVLDDVWNENREKWLSLKYLLMGGGKGSRLLITTCSETVAKISDTTKPYTLRGLNQEDSWSLFKEMAFKDGKEPENSTIKAIGKEVARKCQGVPLAIRTIGGLLHTKYHETEWLNFKENKLSRINQEENEILPTLKLSYDVLPSHLKHCFAYCSLFPPDYVISVPMLIRLWVAQGFIKSSGENESLEDVAYGYFMELLCRSFFQEENDEFGIIRSCKMHDLMNELAVSVSGVGSAVVDLNRIKFHEKLRHVSFNFDVDLSKWEVPTSLLNAKKIRTFLLPCQEFRGCSVDNSFCATIISNFKSLRMLSLEGLGITKLPNCLKKLKHLRYLDLSDNYGIKRLPDWIVGLSNLETLDLGWCQSLVELPRDIKKMINLRHLILKGCYGLIRMPRGLGELNGFRTLNTFVLSENNSLLRDSAAGLGELGRLKELRGELEIKNLRHEKDVMSESNVGTPLKEKQHLHSLGLEWKPGEDVNAIDEKDIIMSMEVLQPHSNLKMLSVWYYGGVRFASWFSSLINLVELRLWGCLRCQHLPPLDHFPSLKFLQLEWFEKLEYISDNTSSSNSMSDEMMTSLECLWVKRCPVLKGWWRAHTHNNASSFSSSTENLSLPSFPSLSQLAISKCPNLSSMPLYPNVEIIDLNGCSSKVVHSLFVRGASDITHDVGVDVSASSSSPHLSKLTHLSINNIEDLECLTSQGMGNVPSLQSLYIADCPNLALLPYHGMGNLASLRELTVINCSNLTSMSEGIANLTSLQELTVISCPYLTSMSEGIANLTSLRELTVRNCSNLTSMSEEIANLTSLQKLTIGEYSDLTLPPEVVVNLPSLQSLTIESFPNLVSLPEEISNLMSLQHLEIRSCPDLASVPEGIRRLTNLNRLQIWECPMLSERCKKETGEDWPKIAHIPSIYIY